MSVGSEAKTLRDAGPRPRLGIRFAYPGPVRSGWFTVAGEVCADLLGFACIRPLFLQTGQASIPIIITGMSMSATPLFFKSQMNCSKYETPVDISSANPFTGTISIP